MIYATKQRAVEVAAIASRNGDKIQAARTVHGWTIRHNHGYSNSDVLEWV